MSEADIFQVVRSVSAAYAGLFGQIISINFAMIVAIFYFLNRAGVTIKLLAYLVYLVGMFLFIGLLLMESNIKAIALAALAAIPADKASSVTTGLLALQHSWLATATAVFLNGALWVMALSVAFLLFVWKKPAS